MSFEEIRLRHYELAAQGNEQQAIQEVQALVSTAEAQIQNALSNVDGAIKYILDGENQHPNRVDICNAKGAASEQPQIRNATQQIGSPFNQASNVTTRFGQPSTAMVLNSPLTSTSTQLSAPTPNFGQSTAPAFGQSSFGQTSTLGRPSTSFGQPSSAVGQSSTSAPTFGQPSGSNPFGGMQQTTTAIHPASNPFQQTSIAQAGNPFQQPSTPAQPSVFGQPSGLTQSAPFRQASATSNANPFARPSPTRSSSTANQGAIASDNPFALSTTKTQLQPPAAFMTTTSSNMVGPSVGGQTSNAQMQKDTQGNLTMWNSKPVSYVDEEPCYRGKDGSWQKIWYPDGAPAFVNSVALPDEVYDDATRESYQHLKERGIFKDGVMPLLPPKKEWCSWII